MCSVRIGNFIEVKKRSSYTSTKQDLGTSSKGVLFNISSEHPNLFIWELPWACIKHLRVLCSTHAIVWVREYSAEED